MQTVVIIAAVFAAYLGFWVLRGSRIIRRREACISHIRDAGNVDIEYLGCLSYQGGFPDIPTLQKLNIAASKDHLLLFTNNARFGKLAFCRFQKMEMFTTSRKQNSGTPSIVMWGPLNHLYFRDTIRHFIVINYTDPENHQNNLLFEHNNKKELEEIFDRLLSMFRTHRSIYSTDPIRIFSNA
jgi:hypothetical protein